VSKHLGDVVYEEQGYIVREVFDASPRSRAAVGFTIEGPGTDGVMIYPEFIECVSALKRLAGGLTPFPPARK
jgi:hypothetical protein